MRQVKYDLKEIYKWPTHLQYLVLGFLLFLLLYFFYLFDINELQRKLSTSQAEEQTLKADLKTLMEDSSTNKLDLNQLPQLEKQLNLWQDRLLDSKTLPTFLDQIISVGSAIPVKFNLFEPGAEKKEFVYFKVPVSINITGTFDQIAQFISTVVNMPKLAIVSSFNIVSVSREKSGVISILKSEDVVQSDLVIDIYRR